MSSYLSSYFQGCDVLIGAIVIPSVAEYPLARPEDFADDMDASMFEVEEVVGEVPRRLFVPDQDVILQRDDGTAPYGVYRLFAHRPGIRYEGAHNAV